MDIWRDRVATDGVATARGRRSWPLLAGCGTALYFALIRLAVGDVLGPDNEAYAAYVAEWLSGSLYSQWTAPKPLEITVIGLLHGLTGSMHVAGFVFDAAMGVLVWAACRLIAGFVASRAALVVFVAAIAASPFFIDLLATGGSGVLSTALVFVAVERIVAKRMWRGRLDSPVGVVPLFLAGLSRPEHWITAVLIALLLGWWKYRAGGLSGFRPRDALILLPSTAPLAWVAFDAVAFGDPFYTTHVASGYVDNVRFVFGWSAPVSAAQFPVRLASYLSDAMPVSLALLAIPGAAYGVWRDRRTGGHLTALLMIPALATGAVYFVSTVFGGMAVFARFFVLDYVVVLIAAVVGLEGAIRVLGSVEPRQWQGAGRVALVGSALVVLTWSGWPEALPTWWRYEALRTEKTLHDEAARRVAADDEFSAEAYIVVPARTGPRYLLRLPTEASHVFTLRQLAELEGHPLFSRDIAGLMRAMEPRRGALMVGQRQQLADMAAPAHEGPAVVFLVVPGDSESRRIDALVAGLVNQSSTVTALMLHPRVAVYRLVTS